MFNFLWQGKVGEMMAPIKSPEAQLLIAIQNKQQDKVSAPAFKFTLFLWFFRLGWAAQRSRFSSYRLLYCRCGTKAENGRVFPS